MVSVILFLNKTYIDIDIGYCIGYIEPELILMYMYGIFRKKKKKKIILELDGMIDT